MSLNIQRFHAPTAREALALARAAFGDGTLILSNRQVDNGVEVTAAAEDALSALDALGDAPVVAPAAAAPVREAAPAPMASTQEVVHADTEQLAMSTLSFQDYVRERMLRKQHEARGASAPVEPTLEKPARAEAPAPLRPVAATPLRPVSAPVAMPLAVADAIEEALAAPIAKPVVPAVAEHIAAPTQPDASANVMAELRAMKQMMEARFNTLSWLGQARQDPIHSNLMLKLVRAGYSPALARAVLEPIAIGPDAAGAVRAVMSKLERMLSIDAGAQTLTEEGGVFALIGATGVGKTTTIAKLAAQCTREHGANSVGLVTLDTNRAGAHEQLRAFGRQIGVVAHIAHDRAALHELLILLSGKKMVLVDTPGIAPRDARRTELLQLLDIPNLKRVLVLNAGAHGDTLDEVASSFKAGGMRDAIISKVDEAVKLGPVIDTVIRRQLHVRGIANGQRVPEDWKNADAAELVRDSMRSAQRAPFDPHSGDIDFYFSPAECAL